MSDNLGLTLRRLVEEREVSELARKTGLILAMESLWYEMADSAYQLKRRQTMKSWFEAGEWFGKRYSTGGLADPLEAFKRDLTFFTWNAPELSIARTNNEVLVRVASPRFTESYTYLFESFLEGALAALGYKVTSTDMKQGIIRLTAAKEVSPP